MLSTMCDTSARVLYSMVWYGIVCTPGLTLRVLTLGADRDSCDMKVCELQSISLILQQLYSFFYSHC